MGIFTRFSLEKIFFGERRREYHPKGFRFYLNPNPIKIIKAYSILVYYK